MSQNAYALFQTIKKIKGYIMIRTSTYATQKYALSDTYLLSPTTNITRCGQSGSPATVTILSALPVSTTNSRTISLNGSPNIKFSFWFGQALVAGEVVRINGWSKTTDNKYVPSLLYRGTITELSTGTASTINSVNTMKPVITMLPSVTLGASFQPVITTASTVNPIPYSYMPGSGTSPASLILNTFGFTNLTVEFSATNADTDDSKNYNAYVTEF